MADNLKQKAASSIVWTSIQKFASIGIQFISGIVLARLLTPFDYGCIEMLAIFMVLANTFVDAGFGSALIQKKHPTQNDYSTIFYWNLGMAALLYVILFFCAPFIARFFEIPLLKNVLRVQGLVLFISAFNLVQRNQLQKNMNFKLLSIVTVITSLISLGITIFLAYKGFGVWALVAQNMITAAIPAIVFWFYVKWRPIWVFSRQSFKELFDFGLFVFLSQLVNQLGSKITALLIGKIYNPSTLGIYSKAGNTEALASSSISSIMTQITYPLYSQLQDDKNKMGDVIKRLTASIAYVTFPMMFVLMLIAEPLFVLLYSERWLDSVPFFQALCLVGLADCLQAVNVQAIAAIGKSRLLFRWTVVKRTLGSAFILSGLFIWGMKGLVCGAIMYNWFCYFVNVGLVSKHIGYKWYRQLLDLMPMGLAALLSAVVAYGIAWILHLSMYPDGIVKMVICLVFYMGWSFIFKPVAYRDILTIIPEKYRFWEKWGVKGYDNAKK